MINYSQHIQVLNEVLPLVKRFTNRIIVVKYGGSVIQDSQLKNQVIQDVLFLSSIGIKLVLVHGGGPIINTWLKKSNIEPKFHNGVRVTDSKTMEIVEMVLVGKVNKDLVALLNKKDDLAVGISGKDGNLISALPMFNTEENFVGKVDKVNTKLLNLLLDNNYIPVIASIASDINGQVYNINADTVAGSIAMALKAEKLILLTDTPGIMFDIKNPNTLLKNVTVADVEVLKKKNIISGGMIPKVDCSVKAVQSSVKSVHIIDGRIPNALLLEILTIDGIGSMMTL
uniref:Acetylglutamate kinase n=1 Tax=Riquetophycus sp. TaxID=1897556 RepID=A0A1C9C8F0_9FLOR|nr:acetylglutamate kinase [Riquetophycus sp.]